MKEIAKVKELCCGCGACSQICSNHCITMREDEQGFLYPNIDEKHCTNCGLCEKVCPYLNQYPVAKEKPISYACRSNNEALVAASSSGGMFSVFADWVLDQGGVVFGAKFDEKWAVVHDYTETKEGLSAFRGSKYVQSTIGDNYLKVRDFLRKGRKVLFSGTPCQVSGLNHFLIKRYDNLYTIDIVCHCVPSPKVWQSYLEELSIGKKIKTVSFRDKSEGWARYGLAVTGETVSRPNAEIRTNVNVQPGFLTRGNHNNNIYMKAFLSNLLLRPGCTNCPAHNYTSGADITIADCWGFNKYHPELDDDKGMSLVLLSSEKGKQLYEMILPMITSLKIPYEEVEEKALHNPITVSPSFHHYHHQFFGDYVKGKGSAVILMKKYLKKGERRSMRKKATMSFIRNLVGERIIKKYKIIKSRFIDKR